MKQVMKFALGALMLVGSIQPMKAGIITDLGRLADSTSSKALEYAVVGLVLYPFIKDMYAGQVTTQIAQQGLVEYVKTAAMPYAKHALILAVAGYGAKFLIKKYLLPVKSRKLPDDTLVLYEE